MFIIYILLESNFAELPRKSKNTASKNSLLKGEFGPSLTLMKTKVSTASGLKFDLWVPVISVMQRNVF